MTQHYVGTKIILAWAQEKEGVEGYAVKYNDGYTSWSPKEAFEASYLVIGHIGHLPEHVQRLAGEFIQQADRLGKALNFIGSSIYDTLDSVEKSDLACQTVSMFEYVVVLARRLARVAPTMADTIREQLQYLNAHASRTRRPDLVTLRLDPEDPNKLLTAQTIIQDIFGQEQV